MSTRDWKHLAEKLSSVLDKVVQQVWDTLVVRRRVPARAHKHSRD